MLKLLFKTTAYYVIWQKFKKQIILVIFSIILIGLIGIVYEDLFEVMKVNSKDNIGLLLFFKWFLICMIIILNILVLRKTKVDYKKVAKSKTSNEKDILNKNTILSTSDLILKKYEKPHE